MHFKSGGVVSQQAKVADEVHYQKLKRNQTGEIRTNMHHDVSSVCDEQRITLKQLINTIFLTDHHNTADQQYPPNGSP
jgi:hypothetical protein